MPPAVLKGYGVGPPRQGLGRQDGCGNLFCCYLSNTHLESIMNEVGNYREDFFG